MNWFDSELKLFLESKIQDSILNFGFQETITTSMIHYLESLLLLFDSYALSLLLNDRIF